MSITDNTERSVNSESSILRVPSLQDVPNEVVQPDSFPEVAIQPPVVASPSKIGLNPRRKKSLITPQMEERIKERERKQKERSEKKLLLKKQAEHAKEAIIPSSPAEPEKKQEFVSLPTELQEHLWKPGQSGNPAGRPKTKYTRDAIVKIIAEVKAVDKNDPNVSTRWQKLMAALYERALNSDTKTADLMLIMNFLAERLDGKSAADVEDGSEKPALTININATRFGMQSTEKGEVINVNPV